MQNLEVTGAVGDIYIYVIRRLKVKAAVSLAGSVRTDIQKHKASYIRVP